MKSWSIKTRFTVAILIFCMPICVLLYLSWKSAQATVGFSEKELEGIIHLTQLSALKRKTVDAHFRLFTIKTTQSYEWAALKEEWAKYLSDLEDVSLDKEKVLADLAYYADATDEEKKTGGRFLSVIRGLSEIRGAISDSHNIVLDPDTDSFYVMDTLINWLPRIHEIQAESMQVILNADPEMAELYSSNLLSLMPLMSEASKKVLDALLKIKKYDQDFYDISESFQQNYAAYEENIRTQLREMNTVAGNPEGSFRNKESSIDRIKRIFFANETMIRQLYGEFQFFVSRRIEVQKAQLEREFLISILSLLFAVSFSGYLGWTINSTIKTFQGAVTRLKVESEAALSVGESLIDASDQVSRSSTQQAASIEETSASLEELTSMVKINADNSSMAQELSKVAMRSAEEGAQNMTTLQADMDQISESSKQIENIMKIIDDISFQTNLLALNASVEAARAGEHGKGFAVVADAVRTLAQKSASSASEINALISASLDRIHAGKNSANSTSVAMSEILESIKKVNSLNTDIAQASSEQRVGIEQIGVSISSLEKTTAGNADIAVQASGFSKKSLNQASQLSQIVRLLEGELTGKSHKHETNSHKVEGSADLNKRSEVEDSDENFEAA